MDPITGHRPEDELVTGPASRAATASAKAGLFHCPACLRPVIIPWRIEKLYGVRVCSKCRNGLASRRQFAYLVDRIAFAVFSMGVAPIVQDAFPSRLSTGAESLLAFLVLRLIFLCKDGIYGKSLGKLLAGIRVVDVTTRAPIGVPQSLVRNLPMLIPYIGVLGIFWTMMKGGRWGDGWANTMVVWDRYKDRLPFADLADINAYCRSCGYDLTGNVSGRCPECGVDIPPQWLGRGKDFPSDL